MKRLSLSGIVFGLTLLLILLNPLQVVVWKMSDLLSHNRAPNPKITIIAIDDASISPDSGLGRFRDWPRSYYAQLLEAINVQKPAVVAFDLDFREASRGISELRINQLVTEFEKRAEAGTASGFNWYELVKRFSHTAGSDEVTSTLSHPDDRDFSEAIQKSGSVVLTSVLTFDSKSDEVVGSIDPLFGGENVSVGYTTIFADRDGVVRRFTPKEKDKASFSAAVARAAVPTMTIPETSSPSRIAFTGVPGSFKTLSFVDVMEGKFDPADIAGKIVLIGATAGIINDVQITPTSSEPMSGVELHANMIAQLIENKHVTEQGWLGQILFALVLALGLTWLFFVLPLPIFAVGGVAAAVVWPLVAYVLYGRGWYVNVVYPEIEIVVSALGVLWYRNKTELKEKRYLKQAFAHYVSPVVVDEIVSHPETLQLGGARKEITVLFSDIVGFTTLSEKLSPEDTVAILNDYLSAMTEVVFENHGTLDKFQGDAIMALFGAPLDDAEHAVNACRAALGMRKALAALHNKWSNIPSLPFKEELTALDFRVGIATGPAVIGNVGSEKRFDYTAIGDIVNLGSRLESVNKKYGTRIIVDKNTFTAATENKTPFTFRKLDVVRVKGKKIETEIFEVMGLAEQITPELRSVLDVFENGRIMYTERNFIGAKENFSHVLEVIPEDGPAQIYKNRCDFFLRKPPTRDWTAVITFEEK